VSGEPTRVILDCDPGHDDAIAILLALASPELDLLGVTTVAGNQTLAKTTANALRVLEFAGCGGVPFAAGAERPLVRAPAVAAHVHGETGLDGPELPPPRGAPIASHAVSFIAEAIRAHAGRVTLIPTGPLTNVALLLALEPDARPERIVLMGGAVGEGNRTPAAEFNIWSDPEAARRVFESGIDLTMVGLDVTHRALLSAADGEELRRSGRTGRLAAELLDFYGRFHRRSYPELDGSPLHDPVAVAQVVWPSLLELRPARVEVDCAWGEGRGRTNVHWRGREDSAETNARVAFGIDGRRFASSLIERLASLG
jgi:inosine-uridine nucleoside N-ribohydrolase